MSNRAALIGGIYRAGGCLAIARVAGRFFAECRGREGGLAGPGRPGGAGVTCAAATTTGSAVTCGVRSCTVLVTWNHSAEWIFSEGSYRWRGPDVDRVCDGVGVPEVACAGSV